MTVLGLSLPVWGHFNLLSDKLILLSLFFFREGENFTFPKLALMHCVAEGSLELHPPSFTSPGLE